MEVRTRFAPSPTGFIHVGSAYSALLDYAWAKKHGGQFIIRIEDTDVKRKVKGAEETIYQGLAWLGIKPDESPQIGGRFGPYRQSERLPLYQQYARQLVDQGQAYYCFCSAKRLAQVRKKMERADQPPMYDRRCRGLNPQEAKARVEKGEKYVIRMKIPDDEEIVVPEPIRGGITFNSNVVDDQVILKSDGFPTYHLAVVVDDHLMKITHAIRGEEWLPSAPKHVLLYRYFGWQPPVYLHTPTIRDEKRKKLSKRLGHAALTWYQKEGYLPEALINFLCLLGWSHPQEKEIFPLKEFLRLFELKDLSPVGPVFGLDKLDWMNGMYIRQKSDKELVQLIKPFVPKGLSPALIKQTIPLVKKRLRKLSEYPDLVDFFIQKPKVSQKILIQKGKTRKETAEILSQLATQLGKLSETDWQHDQLEKIGRALVEKSGWSASDLFMTARIALTGKTATPPLFETMVILGKKKTIKRLLDASKLIR